MLEKRIPHNLSPNMNDKDLVKSLFGNRVNLAYVIHSDAHQGANPMQGKLCKNASHEWLLLAFADQGLIILHLDLI